VVFVEYPPFYDRPVLYGDYEDNRLRFAFLARAALEYFRSRGERPDVFHAHDWQTGLVPVYLKAFYWDDPTLHRMPSVFTIHNVAYQGQFGMDTLGLLGLPWHLGTPDALEYHGGVSYLKGGTMFAELVNTVSPTYALEIQGPEHGFGFDGVVRARASDVVGILNGVDYEEWDPAGRPARREALLAGGPLGQGRVQGGPPAGLRPRRVPRPAPRGGHLAPRLAEGLRHRGRGLVGPAPPAAAHGGPRHRATTGPGGPAPPPAARPRPLLRALRLRRGARPQGHGGQRHLPDALALRAVRAHPDVRPALRDGARGAVDGGAGRHRGAVRPGAGQGHRLPLRHRGRDGPRVGARPGARRLPKDREAWAGLVRRAMAREFSWERSAREYVELYRRAAAKARPAD
jgi:hypothetical protein